MKNKEDMTEAENLLAYILGWLITHQPTVAAVLFNQETMTGTVRDDIRAVFGEES